MGLGIRLLEGLRESVRHGLAGPADSCGLKVRGFRDHAVLKVLQCFGLGIREASARVLWLGDAGLKLVGGAGVQDRFDGVLRACVGR